jgi:hypothetical protein
MKLAADELLAQIRADWPAEYEVSMLRLSVDTLQRENDLLKVGQLPSGSTYSASSPRPFTGDPGEASRLG